MAVDVGLTQAEQLALVRLASATGHVAAMARNLTEQDVVEALGAGPTGRTAAAALAKIRTALKPVGAADTLRSSA